MASQFYNYYTALPKNRATSSEKIHRLQRHFDWTQHYTPHQKKEKNGNENSQFSQALESHLLNEFRPANNSTRENNKSHKIYPDKWKTNQTPKFWTRRKSSMGTKGQSAKMIRSGRNLAVWGFSCTWRSAPTDRRDHGNTNGKGAISCIYVF